VFEAHFQNIN